MIGGLGACDWGRQDWNEFHLIANISLCHLRSVLGFWLWKVTQVIPFVHLSDFKLLLL